MSETTPPELPELQQALLDPATLADLFRDIELGTELISVIRKDAAEARAEDEELTLARARELLEAGGTRGIQVRYRFQGAQWWDTLIRAPGGVRLVRIRHTFG